jgi:hypothetical protein
LYRDVKAISERFRQTLSPLIPNVRIYWVKDSTVLSIDSSIQPPPVQSWCHMSELSNGNTFSQGLVLGCVYFFVGVAEQPRETKAISEVEPVKAKHPSHWHKRPLQLNSKSNSNR